MENNKEIILDLGFLPSGNRLFRVFDPASGIYRYITDDYGAIGVTLFDPLADHGDILYAMAVERSRQIEEYHSNKQKEIKKL